MHKVQLDRRDLKELLALKETRAPKVLLDLRVHRDPLEPKVPQVLRVRLALKELRDHKGPLVLKEM